MSVDVLDANEKPLEKCTEKRARLLLERNRACVIKSKPFAIRLLDRTLEQCGSHLADMEIKECQLTI